MRRFFAFVFFCVVFPVVLSAASGGGYWINPITGQHEPESWGVSYSVTQSDGKYYLTYTASSSRGGHYISASNGSYPQGLLLSGSEMRGQVVVYAVYSSANNIVYLNSPIVIPREVTLEPQEIAVTPTEAEIPLNQLIDMAASGGQNQYVWSVTGPGVISGSGPSVSIGWGEQGVYTVSVYNEAGGGYAQSNTATATITVVNPLLPQLVTVTPATGAMVVGDRFALLADGAQAGNPYSWSMTSVGPDGQSAGGGLVSKDHQAILIPTKEGTYTVKVWASAGNGYDRSDDAIATITVQPGGGGNSAVITFDNSGRDYPVTFRVYQDGVVVHTEVVPGGMTLVKRVQLKSDSPYTVTAVLKDPRLHPDGTWEPGSEEEVVVGGGSADGSSGGDATPPPPEDTPPPEEPADPETDPDGAFQQQFAAAIKEGLDHATVVAGKMRDQGEHVSSRFGPGPSPSPSAPSGGGSGAHSLGTHGGKSLAILKNPFDPNGPLGGVMSSAAGLIKRFIAWGVVLTFIIWCQERVRKMILDPFAVAPFGNSISSAANSASVFGISVGQGLIVRMVVLAAIVLIILPMPLICLAAVQAGLPWAELTQTAREGVNLNGGPSILQNAVGLAGEVLPWGVLLAAPAWYFIVNNVIFPSQLFWTMFIKFVP